MPSLLLIDYLQRSRAYYSLIRHPIACTAAETARMNRLSARQFAKVVILRIDNNELAMMVVPSHYRVLLDSLRQTLSAETVQLAEERQFQRRFPRCEPGAMPPFGHLFGLRAFIAPQFDEFADIHFKAGTHTELLRMPYSEFRRLAHAEPVEKGAAPQVRKLAPAHLQRLLELSVGKKLRDGGHRGSRHLAIPS